MHQRRRSEKFARWIAILYRRGAANAKKSALNGELLDETERECQKRITRVACAEENTTILVKTRPETDPKLLMPYSDNRRSTL